MSLTSHKSLTSPVFLVKPGTEKMPGKSVSEISSFLNVTHRSKTFSNRELGLHLILARANKNLPVFAGAFLRQILLPIFGHLLHKTPGIPINTILFKLYNIILNNHFNLLSLLWIFISI